MALNQSVLDQIGSFKGLYDPSFEHDACGVGFVASIEGKKSNYILKQAILSVCALTHRGAMDADAKTGDGAGVLTQIPHELFRPEVEKLGHQLFRDSDLGVGMFFLPRGNAYAQARCRKITEEVLAKRGLFLFGFRTVPVNMKVLGDKALATCPQIEQVLVGRPDDKKWSDDDYERLLFLARNEIEDRAQADNIQHFYIPSFSSRTIVYKGLLASPQLEKFYLDLRNPAYKTALAVFHQRYSTNTFPTWPLAQSFRMLSHNGEINTVAGNRLWMKAREPEFNANFWGEDIKHLRPIIQPGGSDSASLDNALEVLVMSGRDLLHSMMMLVPAAWENDLTLTPEVRGFYEYHACLNEPWDGPAALVFSNGITIGACLDRNGLRPARYKITNDGLMIMSSEVGVSEIDDKNVVEKGRLAPGEIIAIDTEAKKLFRNDEIKKRFASQLPYASWVQKNLKTLAGKPSLDSAPDSGTSLLQRQLAFGYSDEDIKIVLKPMAETAEEATGSMGDDTPLAVLSRKPRLLYTYFKQLFAQVTNPPIDPIREKLVMSLDMYLGRSMNWLCETEDHTKLLRLTTPFLTSADLTEIKALNTPELQAATVSCLFPAAGGIKAFEGALNQVCSEAEKLIDSGKTLLILSDRGIDAQNAALPMLLVAGAVQHHLLRTGKRMRAGLICETAECREVQHFACLLGYGVSAINPYLAIETYQDLVSRNDLKVTDPAAVAKNYRYAIEKGLQKIMSKMGISTLASYSGAQIFEAIGVHSDVIAKYFTGTASRIGGVGLKEICDETLARHQAAFVAEAKLSDAGFYRYRRDGETHAFTPPVIQNLHTYVGIKGREKAGKVEDYQKYVAAVLDTSPISVRHCLNLKKSATPIPLEEVEPVEEIRRRFTTAGMSLGALSPEAHETLAIAMNRIGGKSNSGEGGEDRVRFTPMENGDSKNSAIKQIASGRFGVTAEYLASATEIEIKMAQGAKPGEGGALAGIKVQGIIARLRHATPGTSLISPPPHHDIYSIEDLAQLIYDLKQVNPRAKVCVKLVAEAGVGTIAAGVAKAHADIILIAGHDGGTGNAPISSVKYAGSPWEIGLAETQQVLLLNGLRNRVTLRTDGGMRTGYDIVVGGLLGAEEFNFGTTALIATGCVYVRQCHANTCPVGVATQDENLRAKFKGSPDNVVAFFNGVAEEVREIMASLGIRTFNQLVGRTDLLEQRTIPDHPKANTLDLKPLLAMPELDDTTPRYHTWERNDRLEDRPLDEVILQDAKSALQTKRKITRSYKVRNINRSVGTQLSGEIAYRYGDEGLPDNTIEVKLTGSVGQSLGAFLVKGIRLHLSGEANDYVGKGMSGGEIILCPPPGAKFDASKNSICGNTVLYGATGGSLFVKGRAGERFGVRNSGANAVVDGIGDHGCEYMTNGTIVVLGTTGKNFGAGMSGGLAYVLDTENVFEKKINPAMIGLERLSADDDTLRLKELIYKHLELTESATAKEILGNWAKFQPLFWKVVPHPPVQMPAKAVSPEAAAAVKTA
jgi:glutamate synthase domain-containing protein 2/glutamate synthase domain-containing protein 1/glutamate synthase domain-containing protein 3